MPTRAEDAGEAPRDQVTGSGPWVLVRVDGSGDGERWVLDASTGHWVAPSSGRREASLAAVLDDVELGADIEVSPDGPDPAEVVGALPLHDEIVGGFWWGVDAPGVGVGDVLYGPFVEHGWLALTHDDDEYPGIPLHRLLVEISHSEEGGFTSGRATWLLGEVRPGLLIDYRDMDGMERDLELFSCDVSDYPEQMRTALGIGFDAVDLAVERALEEGPGSWDGDELDPEEGSPTASIWVWYDESVLNTGG